MDLSGLVVFINLSIIVFLITGIAWGVARGALKSFLRLLFLILNCLVLLMVTPYISSFIINMDLSRFLVITINGLEFTNLNEFFNYFINNNETIVALAQSNPLLERLIQELPKVFVNFLVFIPGFFILKILTYPLYSWLIRKTVEKVATNESRPDKKRSAPDKFIGAFLGFIQAGLTSMVLFLPLTALSLFIEESPDSQMVVHAHEINKDIDEIDMDKTDEDAGAGADVDEEDMDLEGFFGIYYETILPFAIRTSTLSGLNNLILTEMSSIVVDGNKISIAAELVELRIILNQVNDILYPYDINTIDQMQKEEIVEKFLKTEYESIDKLVNGVFNLGSVKLLGDDIIEYLNINFVEEFRDNIDEIECDHKKELFENLTYAFSINSLEQFKNDIDSLLIIIESFYNIGLNKIISSDEVIGEINKFLFTEDVSLQDTQTVDFIVKKTLDQLAKSNRFELRNQVFYKIFNTDLIQRSLIPAINYATREINSSQDVNIRFIDEQDVDWEFEATNASIFVADMVRGSKPFYDSFMFDGFNLNEFLDTTSFELYRIGSALNIARRSNLFGYIYIDGAEQLFRKHVQNNGNDTIGFKYIDLENLDWDRELEVVNNFLDTVLYQSKGVFETDIDSIRTEFKAIFDTSIVKETYYQANSFIFEQIKESNNDEMVLEIISNLENMSLDDLSEELMIILDFAEVGINLVNVIQDSSDSAYDNLRDTSVEQLEAMFEKFIESEFIAKLSIDNIRSQLQEVSDKNSLNLDLDQIDANNLSATDALPLASMTYKIKELYLDTNDFMKEIRQAESFEFSKLEQLNGLEIERLGTAINEFKNIPAFQELYVSAVNSTLFNIEAINKLIKTEEFHLTESIMKDWQTIMSIDWESEILFTLALLDVGVNVYNDNARGVLATKVENLIKDHGDNVLANTMFREALAYFFTEADRKNIDNIKISDLDTFFVGLTEVLSILRDFKETQTTLTSQERARVLHAIRDIGSNAPFRSFLEEVTGVSNVDYMELSEISYAFFDLIELREVRARDLTTHLEYIEMVIPFLYIVEKYDFSLDIFGEAVMPYHFRVFAKEGVTGSRLRLYNIHLGEMLEAQRNDESYEIEDGVEIDSIIDAVRWLNLIPGFIVVEFSFDPDFSL